MTKSVIGFIGLGVMGEPMAKNLVKAGYPLVAHDIRREPVRELVGLGAEEVFSPKEVAERSQVIITMAIVAVGFLVSLGLGPPQRAVPMVEQP